MKLIRALAILSVIAATVFASQKDYSNGYKEGYKKGWCYQKNFCMEPMAPMAPMAPMGRDTYTDGYNDGFLKGLAARQ